MTSETAFAIIISGVISGSLYALMASGLSLVWGTLRVFDFAHGTLLMLAAYVAWYVGSESGLNGGILIALVVSVVFMTGFGLLLYGVAVRPFIGRPDGELMVIIATISAATIIQNGALLIWGPLPKQVPPIATGQISVMGTFVSAHQVAIILLAPALLLAMTLVLKRTRVGLAVRAVEQNQDSAQLAGVNPGAVFALTFAASAVLAGIAGVLLAAIQFITPDFGSDPLVKAFIVVILGGLGSLPGTILGAYLIGLLEAFSIFFFGLYWTPVVLFSVIIGVMLVRPNGLLGSES